MKADAALFCQDETLFGAQGPGTEDSGQGDELVDAGPCWETMLGFGEGSIPGREGRGGSRRERQEGAGKRRRRKRKMKRRRRRRRKASSAI